MRYVTSVPHLERPLAMNAGSIALLDENGGALLADGSVDGERESDGAARDDRRDAGVDLEYAGRARCGGRENDIGGAPSHSNVQLPHRLWIRATGANAIHAGGRGLPLASGEYGNERARVSRIGLAVG